MFYDVIEGDLYILSFWNNHKSRFGHKFLFLCLPLQFHDPLRYPFQHQI